jgi:hypothetical protein
MKLQFLLLSSSKAIHNKAFTKAGLRFIIQHFYYYQHLCLNLDDPFQMPYRHKYIFRSVQKNPVFKINSNGSIIKQ